MSSKYELPRETTNSRLAVGKHSDFHSRFLKRLTALVRAGTEGQVGKGDRIGRTG